MTDASGNSDTCSANVTVLDSIAPVADCQDITLALDSTGQASFTPADIDGGSTDNCSVDTLVASASSFGCTNIGTNSVTLTATDPSGNSASCTATVTVIDTIAPVALCTDITLQLDGLGMATLTSAVVDNGSVDNCGFVTDTLDRTSFDCSDIGTVVVNRFLADSSGKDATCSVNVTIEDTTAPVFTCVDADVYLDSLGSGLLSFNDVVTGLSDNCGTVNTIISQDTFGCGALGTLPVDIFLSDSLGNADSCSVTVTVIDSLAPVAICSTGVVLNLASAGIAVLDVMDIGDASTDTCDVPLLCVDFDTFDCGLLGLQTVILTATDSSGNADSCTAQVLVQDTIAPVAVCYSGPVYLDSMGMADVDFATVGAASSGFSGQGCFG